jgi:hypothetical protein
MFTYLPLLLLFSYLRVGVPCVVWRTFKRLYGAFSYLYCFGGGLSGGGRVGDVGVYVLLFYAIPV